MNTCPFCKCDPYHYVDNGVWMERVAITCCDLGIDYFGRDKLRNRFANKVLFLLRSGSPRRVARAKRIINDSN